MQRFARAEGLAQRDVLTAAQWGSFLLVRAGVIEFVDPVEARRALASRVERDELHAARPWSAAIGYSLRGLRRLGAGADPARPWSVVRLAHEGGALVDELNAAVAAGLLPAVDQSTRWVFIPDLRRLLRRERRAWRRLGYAIDWRLALVDRIAQHYQAWLMGSLAKRRALRAPDGDVLLNTSPRTELVDPDLPQAERCPAEPSADDRERERERRMLLELAQPLYDCLLNRGVRYWYEASQREEHRKLAKVALDELAGANLEGFFIAAREGMLPELANLRRGRSIARGLELLQGLAAREL